MSIVKNTKIKYAVVALIKRAANDKLTDTIDLTTLEFTDVKSLASDIAMLDADIAIYKIVPVNNIKFIELSVSININKLTDISKLDAINIGEALLGDKRYWSILRKFKTTNNVHPKDCVATALVVSVNSGVVSKKVRINVVDKNNIELFVNNECENIKCAAYVFDTKEEMCEFRNKLKQVLCCNKYNKFDEIINLISSRTKIKGTVINRNTVNNTQLILVREQMQPSNVKPNYSEEFLDNLRNFVLNSTTMNANDSNMVATWIEGVRGKPTLFVNSIIDAMKDEEKEYAHYLELKSKYKNK